MRRAFNWMGACTVLALAVFVASCDDGPTNVPDQASAPTAAPETAAPSLDVVTLATDVWGDCLNEDADDPPDGTRFNNATCTANDVEIKVLEALEVNGEPVPDGGTVTCTEGEELAVKLRAYFGLNAEERYDIAYFLAEDGGDARIGDCFHDFLDPIDKGGPGDPTGGPPYLGPFADYEADDALDVCGDAAEDDEVLIPGIVDPIAAVKEVPQLITIICQDDDDDGFVEIGTCTSWDNNDKDTCEGVEDAFPGTPSKCNCRPAQLPINVKRSATVKVIKDVKYDGGETGVDDSKWTLTIASPSLTSDETDNVGDDGFIEIEIEWFRDDEPGVNKATVTEAYFSDGAGSGDFYNSTYSCNSTNDAHDVASTSGRSIPEFTDLVNDESIVCTFVNDRIPVPTVTVTKDATPTFTRDWDWTVTKKAFFTADDTEISSGTILGAGPPIALPGMVYDVYYKVEGAPTSTDQDWAVSGTITIVVAGALPPYSGTMNVSDQLTGGITATVDCDDGTTGNQTSFSVTAAGTFTCSYSATLPDATTRTNTATASITWNSGDPGGDTGTADVTFGSPTSETDELAYVCDDKGTPSVSDPCTPTSGDYLGSQTAPATYSFRYDNDLPACTPPGFDRLNNALLTEVDTDTDRTANHALSSVCQDPPPGCTLTQGYWKTHSEYGPAPYDDNWANLANGADTELDTSGESWFDAFWTAPKGGNPWYQLAHQWMAASLNVLNGAGTPSEVADALTRGYELLDQYGSAKRIPKRSDDGIEAKALARLLTQYNEGDIGPGHCDDDRYPDQLFN